MSSFSKDEDALLEDDDIWNDKNTIDYLKYMKLESYFICYNLSFLIFEIQIAFMKPYNIDRYGGREFYPTTVIFIILIAERTINMLNGLKGMKDGKICGKYYHIPTSVLIGLKIIALVA